MVQQAVCNVHRYYIYLARKIHTKLEMVNDSSSVFPFPLLFAPPNSSSISLEEVLPHECLPPRLLPLTRLLIHCWALWLAHLWPLLPPERRNRLVCHELIHVRVKDKLTILRPHVDLFA